MKKARLNSKKSSKVSYIINEKTGKVLIRMADFYPGYNGEKEYEEVERKHFDFLMDEMRKENRELRQGWLHVSKYPIDEILMGEMDGIFEPGADEIMITKNKNNALYNAIKQLSPALQRRIFMYYFQEKCNKDIAEIEGVSPSAVTQSLGSAILQLSELVKVNNVI